MRRLLQILFLSLIILTQGSRAASAGSTIKSDEEVVFFTTSAHLTEGTWVAPIHGWIFEPEEGSIWRGALAHSLRKILRVKKSQEGFFRKRLQWFLVDNERGKKITVTVGGVKKKLSKSGADGHFGGTLRIPATAKGAVAGKSLRIRAKTRSGDKRHFGGRVMLVGEVGLSVISDIDDTIKITGAYDKQLTLERTFLYAFEQVPGMAKAYKEWRAQGAAFHYVSASPWHLFIPLSRFMQRSRFPVGSLHLRDFRLKGSSRWNLLKSSKNYKINTIEKLLATYPRRRFVLVGDTGERDPEVYAEVARRHPKQIEGIFLRLVREMDMSAERRKATTSQHPVPVTIFRDPVALGR